jgi:hypothetical protein
VSGIAHKLAGARSFQQRRFDRAVDRHVGAPQTRVVERIERRREPSKPGELTRPRRRASSLIVEMSEPCTAA